MGYHIYKETTWSVPKIDDVVKVDLETDQSSIANDPYACAIKIKREYFVGWKTIAHVPREISRYVSFFIKQEGDVANGLINHRSLNYKLSPITFWWH